jgi:hypothetical protein
LLRSLKSTYLTVDPRSLGLFRIAFGIVLFADLVHRFAQMDFWYTNTGLLPNHTLLWRPPSGHVFSLFFVASTPMEAGLGFAACACVYVLFTLGYRTRTMQVLALICRVSLNSRLAMLENGGDMVINLLCIFSFVLPLGRRFSIDAWLAALRDDRTTNVDELNSSVQPERERTPVVSPAMFGLILQFAAIYFFNAVSKSGEAWTSGYAVHYALHLDKYVTWIGVWMRETLPIQALRVLTWSVLTAEWIGFTLMITPFFVRSARLVAVLMLPLLHLSFALGLNLGAFSPAMISFFPLLLAREHWDAIGRFLERRTQPVSIEFDCTDSRLFQIARVVRELDRFGRITWTPVAIAGYRVNGVERAAPREVASLVLGALPWGFLLRAPLQVRALRGGWLQALRRSADWSIRAASERRELRPSFVDTARGERIIRWISAAAVVVVIAAIGSEIVNSNDSVPQSLRVKQPAWAKAVIEYPRLLQGWRMFAPEPPRFDTMLHVDATTANGVHVDPYNAVASRQSFPDGDVVPENMNQSQFFTMYSDRIADPNYAAYRQAFLEWLLAYPDRTGKPTDCLTSFDVFLITDESPLPGSKAHSKPVKRERFMQYVAPADSKCMSLQLSAAVDQLRTRGN